MNPGLTMSRSVLALCAAALLAPAAFAANLLVNPSFEGPSVAVGGDTTFKLGDSIEGWTVVGDPGTVSLVSTDYTTNGATFPAHDRQQWLNLAGTGTIGHTGVQQTVATITRRSYVLTWHQGTMKNKICGRSWIDAYVDGQVVGGAGIRGADPIRLTWHKISKTFEARSSSTTIEFRNASLDGTRCVGLDDVSLVLQPKDDAGE